MKTAAPSSECSFPFSNIKYVDCSLSELSKFSVKNQKFKSIVRFIKFAGFYNKMRSKK